MPQDIDPPISVANCKCFFRVAHLLAHLNRYTEITRLQFSLGLSDIER